MADPSIKATLGLDSTQFQQGLQDAERAGTRFQQGWQKVMRGFGFGAAAMGAVRVVESIANEARELEAEMIASGRAIDENVAAASRLAREFDNIRTSVTTAAAKTVGFLASAGEFWGRAIAVRLYGEEQVRDAERAAQGAESLADSLERARKDSEARAVAERQAAQEVERMEARAAGVRAQIEQEKQRAAFARLSLEEQIAEVRQRMAQNQLEGQRADETSLDYANRMLSVERDRATLASLIADEKQRESRAVEETARLQADLAAAEGLLAQAQDRAAVIALGQGERLVQIARDRADLAQRIVDLEIAANGEGDAAIKAQTELAKLKREQVDLASEEFQIRRRMAEEAAREAASAEKLMQQAKDAGPRVTPQRGISGEITNFDQLPLSQQLRYANTRFGTDPAASARAARERQIGLDAAHRERMGMDPRTRAEQRAAETQQARSPEEQARQQQEKLAERFKEVIDRLEKGNDNTSNIATAVGNANN